QAVDDVGARRANDALAARQATPDLDLRAGVAYDLHGQQAYTRVRVHRGHGAASLAVDERRRWQHETLLRALYGRRSARRTSHMGSWTRGRERSRCSDAGAPLQGPRRTSSRLAA